jgi:hypothetical protein
LCSAGCCCGGKYKRKVDVRVLDVREVKKSALYGKLALDCSLYAPFSLKLLVIVARSVGAMFG